MFPKGLSYLNLPVIPPTPVQIASSPEEACLKRGTDRYTGVGHEQEKIGACPKRGELGIPQQFLLSPSQEQAALFPRS